MSEKERGMSDIREALLALLRQADHAPLSAHDPRDGSCRSCPWPLHEMPPEDIADAILLAGWTPPTVKPTVEALTDALAGEGIGPEPGEPDLTPTAERILALLPGRTEAEVKAEALREAASAAVTVEEGIPWGHDHDRATVSAWLLGLAARIARGEGS